MLDYCIPKYITVTFLSHIPEIPSTFFYLLIFFDFFVLVLLHGSGREECKEKRKTSDCTQTEKEGNDCVLLSR